MRWIVIEELNEPLLQQKQRTNEYRRVLNSKDDKPTLTKLTINLKTKVKQQPPLTLRFKGEHL